MRVAAVQFTASADKVDNLDRLCGLVKEAANEGAELVVAPEASMHGFGQPTDPLAPVAEALDGPFVRGLGDAAREHRITVVAGGVETGPGGPPPADNTPVGIRPGGPLP